MKQLSWKRQVLSVHVNTNCMSVFLSEHMWWKKGIMVILFFPSINSSEQVPRVLWASKAPLRAAVDGLGHWCIIQFLGTWCSIETLTEASSTAIQNEKHSYSPTKKRKGYLGEVPMDWLMILQGIFEKIVHHDYSYFSALEKSWWLLSRLTFGCNMAFCLHSFCASFQEQ